MTEIEELRSSTLSLHEKVDRAIAMLEAVQPRKAAAVRPPKRKLLPLTEDEVTALQTEFVDLYEQWVEGHELETQQALEQFDPHQLRRLADANNLNVTSKMAKEKVLQLIGARFREKKQLHKTRVVREEQPN